MANKEITSIQQMKKEFGVSFNKNMSIEDIAKTWVEKASPIAKEKYPQIDTILTAIDVILTAQQTLRTVTVVATTVYKKAKETLEDAASGMLTGGATMAAKIPQIAAVVAEQVQDKLIVEKAPEILNLLIQLAKSNVKI